MKPYLYLNPSHLNKNLISPELLFSETPKIVGDFTNVAGTSTVDNITGVGGEAIFSGDGDDILISKKNATLPTFLSGGDGDDIYKVNKGSFAIIYDIGLGEDLLDINSMSGNYAQSWILDDVQGILISDGTTGALVINSAEIENVKFGGKTYNIENDNPPLGYTFHLYLVWNLRE